MNKKELYITCIVLLLILCIIILVKYNEKKDKVEEKTMTLYTSESDSANTESIDNISVNDRLSNIIKASEYQKGDIEHRAKLLETLMDELISEGIVEKYNVDLESNRPKIEYYVYGKGCAIILLTEFPKDEN